MPFGIFCRKRIRPKAHMYTTDEIWRGRLEHVGDRNHGKSRAFQCQVGEVFRVSLQFVEEL
jgi:hypothetical protein